MLPPTVAFRRTSPSAMWRATLGEQLVRAVGERRDRHHRADHDAIAVDAQLVEAGSVEHQRALGREPPRGDLGQQDRSAGEDGDALAVAVHGAASSADVGNSTSGSSADSTKRASAACVKVRSNLYCAYVAFASIDELDSALAQASYLADRGLATALYLALKLEKPLLLEGEAGVGKTEAAKAIAVALGAPLIRLQCYEGLDIAHAVYEWNYARQLLHIRAAQAGTVDEAELFGREFLIRRPVLEAIESEQRVLLLIDEIDRADEEFEAFLLEVLSDFQVTVPELGTISREAAALRDPHLEPHARAARRAQAPLPLPLDRPSRRSRARSRSSSCACRACRERLAEEAARFAAELRSLDLQKPPGLAETIDWVRALTALGQQELDVENVQATLGSLLKYHEDLLAIRDDALAGLVGTVRG